MLIRFEVKTELSVIQIFRLLLERLEQVTDAVRGECRLAKDAHGSMTGLPILRSCSMIAMRQ